MNGRLVYEKGLRVDPEKDEISVDGKPLAKREETAYFMFNKPKDVISTAKDTHDRKKITDFFEKEGIRLYPVGRLDKDTTGLVIMTNDGGLAHRLAHPSFGVEKEYKVFAEPPLEKYILCGLEKGIEIDGRLTAPCRISPVKFRGKGAEYKVFLHEGRKRQIRLMFQSVGSRVMELERTRYAGIPLGKLAPGRYRRLTDKEVSKLRELVGA